MKHRVTVNERVSEVDFRAVAGDINAVEVEPGVYSLSVAGRMFEARVVKSGGGHRVLLGAEGFQVAIEDPRELSRSGPSSSGEGRRSIAAPMPGKVIRVLVEKGEIVSAGQGLVVVEAMKMQNEMKSPKAGTVVQILAATGATVSAGQTLIVVE